jgi:hypothetical protein
MKKIFLAICIILMATITAHAAGSCVFTSQESMLSEGGVEHKSIKLTCTGDGSITAYSFDAKTYDVVGFYLYSVTTDPGSAAPTADYDITLLVNSEDIAGSLLLDRSSSLTQTVVIAPTTKGYHMIWSDGIAITFANNTANPSTIVLTLKFVKN